MKCAYFDCQFGAAGDMLVAALLAAGLPGKRWREELNKLALPPGSFEIKVSSVKRKSILATKVDVVDAHGQGLDELAYGCRRGKPFHEDHEPEDAGSRSISQILTILDKSDILPAAQDLAQRIFKRLAQAEATVHGINPDQVHFHELGAIDAIVDIAGFAIGLELLANERCLVSPLPLGHGLTRTAHGQFPVPSPAVVALLAQAQAPTSGVDFDFECLTPTGAAILTEIAGSWGQAPAFAALSSCGYGAGTKDTPEHPNLCRVIVGEIVTEPCGKGRFAEDECAVIEANLDDFSPQALSWVSERLQESGALDVLVLPAVMKKGRLGHLLSVPCHPDDCLRLGEIILSETTTLGVRFRFCRRLVAERHWQEVMLAGNESVRIKVAQDANGIVVNAQPEFEDCARYAARHGVTLKEVTSEALAAFKGKKDSQKGEAPPA